MIQPEGPPNYKVPAPAPIEAEIAVTVMEIPKSAADADADADTDSNHLEDSGPCVDKAELEDNEEDRTLDEELVGRGILGYYDNGWFNGSINYFNKKLEEYKITFTDGSIEYKPDIDGVELILLQ